MISKYHRNIAESTRFGKIFEKIILDKKGP
jgi:hypothetical protein